MASKLPFMPLYHARFYGDLDVMALGYEGQGVYLRLLTIAWDHDRRIPDDPEKIRRMLQLSEDDFARLWPPISEFWKPCRKPGFLENRNQVEIYKKHFDGVRRRTVAAKKAANARWGKA